MNQTSQKFYHEILFYFGTEFKKSQKFFASYVYDMYGGDEIQVYAFSYICIVEPSKLYWNAIGIFRQYCMLL